MSPLPELAQALLNPEIYPQPPQKVAIIQTQMSFIFIAGEFVYKVKKPVNLGYLDYTTLEKRKFFCEKEVELNRRLCPDAYLGVIPVIKNGGKYALSGQGGIIEYAVKMRYLPQDRMMNVLLPRNEVTPQMVERVAEKLAQFHEKAETNAAISIFGDIPTIKVNTEENFNQTEKSVGRTISRQNYEKIKDYTRRYIAENEPLLKKRVAEGRIKDCHGDLHAAHVCFTAGICIYDCIEFNDRFRYCDIASEIAFLAMDLDHYGRADLSRHFVQSYVAQSNDAELLKLLAFYKCYRAYVRGKVESFKMDDPYVSDADREHSKNAAMSYFDLAGAYIREKPVLFITVGLVGTGKTSLAQALAKRLGLIYLSSDVIRKQLAGIPATEHRFEEFNSGIYAAEFTRRTYDTLLSEAEKSLREGASVILDASFLKSAERQRAKRVADGTGAGFFVLECVLDEGLVKQRLARRLEEKSVSDGRWEVYVAQKERAEPVTEVSPESHLVIDASLPAEMNVRKVLDGISV